MSSKKQTNTEIQQNLYNKDTIGTTVSSPVQWNLYNKDTIGTTVNCPVQWNLYNKDTIGAIVYYDLNGVLIIEVSLYSETSTKMTVTLLGPQ